MESAPDLGQIVLNASDRQYAQSVNFHAITILIIPSPSIACLSFDLYLGGVASINSW